MATGAKSRERRANLPVIAVDIPVMYEDEGQEEMGEAEIHTDTTGIFHYGVSAHLAPRPQFRVFSNLNLLYHPIKRRAFVSPDVMVVEPDRKLRKSLRSYRIGTTGPGPLMAGEVLSRRSFQQQDLTTKVEIYADIQVPEYVLVDSTGELLPQKLLLKRLQPRGVWRDEQDPDGGVTSRLGFRLLIDEDGRLRVLDAATGHRYVRPDEADDRVRELETRARHILELEAEIERLKAMLERKNRGG